MNIEKAKALLKLGSSESIETARKKYDDLIEKTTKSLNHATNPSVRQKFEQRLLELHEAFDFIDSNSEEFHLSNLSGFEAFWHHPKNKILTITSVTILLFLIIGTWSYRFYQGNKYFEQGQVIMADGFSNQDLNKFKEAISYFEEAISYGNKGALYEKGHCLYKLGDQKTGIEFMKEAVEGGYDNSDDIKFYSTVMSRLK
jgi:tetratricopeptide (TPR) repeat protein